MKKFIFYFIPLSIVGLFFPSMDYTSYILILIVVFHLFYQIGAIISISTEDILYSKKEKIIRISLVLFIPIIGILIEYITANKFDKKDYKSDGLDTTTGGSGYFTGISGGLFGSSSGNSTDSSGGN